MAHYNKQSFVNALKSAEIQPGDIIFGHSNIGYFGFPEEGKTPQTIFEMLLDAFFEVIGPEGTLIAPTYTYSFPQGEVFDKHKSPGIGGIFSEMLRNLPESQRSCDPAISVVAIGALATTLTKDMPANSYGPGCFFERLLKHKAKVCNLNFDAATTFVHFAERLIDVPYRFDKTFKGIIRDNKKEYSAYNTIYVRCLHECTEPVFEKFDTLAKEKKLYKQVKVGRGFIKVMSIEDQFKLVEETIPKQPDFLIKGVSHGKLPNFNELIENNI